MPIRVVLAEDNTLLREGIAQLLERADEIDLVGIAADKPDLEALIEATSPEVVVTDIRMPPTGTDEGIQIAADLRDARPRWGSWSLSQYADPAYALALLDGGSEGRAYLLKERVSEVDELARGDPGGGGRRFGDRLEGRRVAGGRQRRDTSEVDRLTPREREILGEMAQGKSNAAIAATLVLSTGRSRSTPTRSSRSSACPRRSTSTVGSRRCCCTWPRGECGEGSHTLPPPGPTLEAWAVLEDDQEDMMVAADVVSVLIVDDQLPFRLAARGRL